VSLLGCGRRKLYYFTATLLELVVLYRLHIEVDTVETLIL
jgi:hypothetical protein